MVETHPIESEVSDIFIGIADKDETQKPLDQENQETILHT